MRKLKKGRKFGRETDQRRALMRGLASSFFVLGKIQTTEAKAKELRPYVEKFLTRAKVETIANRRTLLRSFSPRVVKKIFERGMGIASRAGGYTRITKLGSRRGDSAKLAIIELVR